MSNEPRILPFSDGEYRRRVTAVYESMEERGLDAILLSIPQNYYYLTGFETGATYSLLFLVMHRDGRSVWVTRKTELSNVEFLAPQMWAKHGVGVGDSDDHVEILARELRGLDLSTASIGYEGESLFFTINHFRQLTEALPQGRFQDITGMIEQIRRRKTPEELAFMRRAGEFAAAGLLASFEELHEGMSEAELSASMLSAAIRAGSGRIGTLPFVSAGPRTFRAHGVWTDRKIGRGEVVNAELAAAFRNYHVPVFRVFSVGPPSDAIQAMHDASQLAMRTGMEGIEPGMTSHDADALVRAVLEREGYGDAFVVRAAYGIGTSFVPGWGEANVMSIRPNDQRILEPGMCFHLVPALYVKEVGCVCCSMPFEVTQNGVAALTSMEPKLLVK